MIYPPRNAAYELARLAAKLEAAERDTALKEKIIDSLGAELNAVAKERDALRAEPREDERQTQHRDCVSEACGCIGEIEMTININELRRLAQAATPGGWYVARGNYVYGCKEVTDGEEVWHPVIACTDDDEVSINFEGNANFIAAANPAAISELLDRLEAAEKEVEIERMRLAACGVAAIGYFEGCAEEYISASLNDVLALRAKIEATEEDRARLLVEMGRLCAQCDALRSKNHQYEMRLRKILEAPEDTMSNSKALAEIIRQARLALGVKK